jgi:hypothetical protein
MRLLDNCGRQMSRAALGVLMKRLVVLAALATASCVSAKPFTTPDGKPAYLVECDGDSLDISSCYDKARETCGGDYEVLRRSEAQQIIEDISTPTRTIEIACKTNPTS